MDHATADNNTILDHVSGSGMDVKERRGGGERRGEVAHLSLSVEEIRAQGGLHFSLEHFVLECCTQIINGIV